MSTKISETPPPRNYSLVQGCYFRQLDASLVEIFSIIPCCDCGHSVRKYQITLREPDLNAPARAGLTLWSGELPDNAHYAGYVGQYRCDPCYRKWMSWDKENYE